LILEDGRQPLLPRFAVVVAAAGNAEVVIVRVHRRSQVRIVLAVTAGVVQRLLPDRSRRPLTALGGGPRPVTFVDRTQRCPARNNGQRASLSGIRK